jgi:hypothetical protein
MNFIPELLRNLNIQYLRKAAPVFRTNGLTGKTKSTARFFK